MRQFLTVRQTKKAVPFSRMCGALVNGGFGFAQPPFVVPTEARSLYEKRLLKLGKMWHSFFRNAVASRTKRARSKWKSAPNGDFNLLKCHVFICKMHRAPNKIISSKFFPRNMQYIDTFLYVYLFEMPNFAARFASIWKCPFQNIFPKVPKAFLLREALQSPHSARLSAFRFPFLSESESRFAKRLR